MKRAKRFLAVLLSMAMVLAMSTTAFAAETPGVPNESNTQTAEVYNVVSGAQVTAYQIVSASYNSSGFVGYQRANGVTEAILKDVLAPTSDEITAIAANSQLLSSLTNKITMSQGAISQNGLAPYTAQLNAGYWVVIVKETGKVVYNPILVGVYYSIGGSNDTLVNEPVNAQTDWDLSSQPAYAKSNKPTLEKEVTGTTKTENNTSGDKHDVAIGDIVDYKITATIPSYSKTYKDVIVTITDQLSTGLALQGTPVVSVNEELATATTDYTYTAGTPANGYTISFNSTYALAHAGKTVVVTYKAKLTDEAATNFDPNTNTAKFIYSNDPQDKSKTEEIEKKTYTYTFEIDGSLSGNAEGEKNTITEELYKGHKISENVSSDSWSNFASLSGADFTLTNKATGKVYKTTTDAKGTMNFKGLDAGEYTLVETKAPAGYTINNKAIDVVITAEYNDDGTLKNYEIKIDNKKTNKYEATYNKDKEITNIKTSVDKTNDPDHQVSDTYFFWNTQLTKLPSTGGIGTTIFTVGGCIIMIIAAGLFFASRRKKAEN